jgi:superfamily II DNA/RNA helicase
MEQDFEDKNHTNMDIDDQFVEQKHKPNKNAKKAKGFRAFNLGENLIESIKKIGYKFPTPIQRKAIPPILSGFNVIAHSRTGTYFLTL